MIDSKPTPPQDKRDLDDAVRDLERRADELEQSELQPDEDEVDGAGPITGLVP